MLHIQSTISQRRPVLRGRRTIWLVVLIVFVAPAFGPSSASAKEICRRFPMQLTKVADLKLIRKGKFDNRAAGAFMKFRGRGQILSLFIYDNGQASITDADVRSHTNDSVRQIRMAANRRGDKIVSEGRTKLWSAAGYAFVASNLRATYKAADAQAYEFVGLSHDTKCMLKVRYTDALDPNREAALRRYKKLVLEVHNAMR